MCNVLGFCFLIYAEKIWDACEAVALCWKAVWAAVDARDGGYCAKALPPETAAFSLQSTQTKLDLS